MVCYERTVIAVSDGYRFYEGDKQEVGRGSGAGTVVKVVM